MMNQVPKEIADELQKLDESSTVQDLYDCVIRLKREKEEKKRLDKSRGVDSKRWFNSSSKAGEDSTKKEAKN